MFLQYGFVSVAYELQKHMTVTSWWARWRLKSSVSRVFVQTFVQTPIKGNINLCVTGLCEGSSPLTIGIPAQRASNTKNVPIWWRHHELTRREKRLTRYAFWLPQYMLCTSLGSSHCRNDWFQNNIEKVLSSRCKGNGHFANLIIAS